MLLYIYHEPSFATLPGLNYDSDTQKQMRMECKNESGGRKHQNNSFVYISYKNFTVNKDVFIRRQPLPTSHSQLCVVAPAISTKSAKYLVLWEWPWSRWDTTTRGNWLGWFFTRFFLTTHLATGEPPGFVINHTNALSKTTALVIPPSSYVVKLN